MTGRSDHQAIGPLSLNSGHLTTSPYNLYYQQNVRSLDQPITGSPEWPDSFIAPRLQHSYT